MINAIVEIAVVIHDYFSREELYDKDLSTPGKVAISTHLAKEFFRTFEKALENEKRKQALLEKFQVDNYYALITKWVADNQNIVRTEKAIDKNYSRPRSDFGDQRKRGEN